MNCIQRTSKLVSHVFHLAAQRQEAFMYLWLLLASSLAFDISMAMNADKSIKEPRRQPHYWATSMNFKWWVNAKHWPQLHLPTWGSGSQHLCPAFQSLLALCFLFFGTEGALRAQFVSHGVLLHPTVLQGRGALLAVGMSQHQKPKPLVLRLHQAHS